MDIIGLYEDLKKYMENSTQYDDLFYDASEGKAQKDIVNEMLVEIINRIS